MSVEGFRFVDLFAGIGGFHAALTALGGRCVHAVEIDARARRVYESNWGVSAGGVSGAGDVRADDPRAVPDHEVLCAGFPCQPFSKSGAQLGMEEARGTLFYDIARIIEAKRPLVVLLENVRNLIGPRHQHEWDVIVTTLRHLGYHVGRRPAVFSPHLLPPRLGGTPQVRERVFITATLAGPDAMDPLAAGPAPVASMTDRFGLLADDDGLFDPRSPDRGWDLLSVLDHTAPPGFGLSDHETHWIDAWDDFVRILRSRGEPLPGFPVWADAWRDFPEVFRLRFPSLSRPDVLKPLDEPPPDFAPRHVTRPHVDRGLPAWKQQHLRRNYDLFERNTTVLTSWAYRWGVFRDEVFPRSRRKLEWQAQGAGSLWETVLQLRPSGIRARPETYLPALVAITQTSIVGRLQRRITPRETARLQGLPDSFVFPDQPDAATYKQLGNGVAVGAVAHVMRRHVTRDRALLLAGPGAAGDKDLARRGRALVAAVEAAPLNPLETLKGHVPRGLRGVQP